MWCFLLGPCRGVTLKTIGATELVESPAVKKRLYVCCNYSETVIIAVIKSVARIRLLKAEKT
jgi:hypothetical protein